MMLPCICFLEWSSEDLIEILSFFGPLWPLGCSGHRVMIFGSDGAMESDYLDVVVAGLDWSVVLAADRHFDGDAICAFKTVPFTCD